MMEEALRKYVVDTFLYGEGTVTDDQALFEEGIIDSLGFMKLLAFIEKQYHVSLDMSEVSMENFATIRTMVETLRKKRGGS